MVYFECPLCCAENFPDEHSLKNHLLNISDNIICPICELQFKTVRSLAVHLVDECKKNEDNSIVHSMKEASLELNPVMVNDPLKLEPESNSPLLCENINGVLDTADENVLLESPQCTLEDEIITNDRLYTCSVCNTTFTSVEDHLKEFHADEHVLVDGQENLEYKSLLDDDETNSDTNKVIQKELDDITYNISESEAMVEDFLPAESSPAIWSSDEMKNDDTDSFIQSKIMFLLEMGSKDIEDDSFDSLQPESKSQCRQTSYVLSSTSVTAEGRWVMSNEGYYYAADDAREQELRDRSKKATMLASAIEKITEESSLDQLSFDLEKVDELPLATFVTVFNKKNDSDIIGIERSPVQEYKPYTYRGHRVCSKL